MLLIGLSNHTAIANYKTNTLQFTMANLFKIMNIIDNKMLVRGIHRLMKIQTEKRHLLKIKVIVVLACCHLRAVFQLCPLPMNDWPSAAHKGMLGSGCGVGGCGFVFLC